MWVGKVQRQPCPPGLQVRGARTVIDTVETVTSGFCVVLPHRSRRTGQEFLSGQPWAEGGATDAVVVVVVVEETGQRTLLRAPSASRRIAAVPRRVRQRPSCRA